MVVAWSTKVYIIKMGWFLLQAYFLNQNNLFSQNAILGILEGDNIYTHIVILYS